MRKILNNLWSQRTNNVWLFLEANILSTQPYETADDSMTQEEINNQYMKREARYVDEANVIKRQLLAIDGVEQASIADPAMGLYARTDLFGGSSYPNMLRFAWQNDTVLAYDICYSMDEHFFGRLFCGWRLAPAHRRRGERRPRLRERLQHVGGLL